MNRINELLQLSLIICALSGTNPAAAAVAVDAEPTGPDAAPETRLAQSLADLRRQLDGRWVEAYGTWSGEQSRAASAAPIRELHLRSLDADDLSLALRLQQATASYLQQLDPVWGGAFELVELTSMPTARRARVSDGSKLAASQAQALEILALAWRQSGEVRYRNALEKVDAFLQDWLAAPGGGYFRGHLGAPAGLPAQLDAARYWSLGTEHERRRFGLPPPLREVLTGDTAALVMAYVAAYEATGEPNYLRVAERLGRLLTSKVLEAAGADEARQVAVSLLRLHEVSLAQDWWVPALRAARQSAAGAPAAESVASEALRLRLHWRFGRHGEAFSPGPGERTDEERLLAALSAAAAPVSTAALAEAARALALRGSAAIEVRLLGSARHAAYEPLLTAAATGLDDPRAVIVRIRSPALPQLVLCRAASCSEPVATVEGFAGAVEALRRGAL